MMVSNTLQIAQISQKLPKMFANKVNFGDKNEM